MSAAWRLVSDGAIDAVTDTDGIDVTNFALGSQFPQGVFVAQDNDDNFKLARWDAIDAAFAGELMADTSWDPRLVGRAQQPPELPGDYNSSRGVDAADYVVWRKTLGQSVTPYSGADGDGNGRVDVADYDVWRAYSGDIAAAAAVVETTSSRSAEPTIVPSDTSQYITGKSSANVYLGARHWTPLETVEVQSNRDKNLPLLLALAGQENQPTSTHSSVGDVQTESNAGDTAFELHLPLASSMRVAAL